jgi:hypothetical protein
LAKIWRVYLRKGLYVLRRVVLLCVASCFLAFAASAGSAAAREGSPPSPDASIASGDCSTATALQLVEQNHLNDFLLPDPVRQVLCGPFAGAGSDAMAITIGAPTCWGVQRWAVFSFTGGAWQLVLDQREFIFPLVAVGADIRETTPVFRPADPRCLPSGGTHARIWHWNGTRLVAGAWKQVTAGTPVKVASFYSPSRNLSCEMGDDPGVRGSYVYCQSLKRPHSVRMGLDGRLKICRGGTITTTHCLGNAGENTPTLGYGRQITVGRFRCRSQQSGVRCTVIRSGKGFLINSTGVTRVGP